MTEVLTTLVGTPIPTILVVAGLGFLVLSLSGKLSAHIAVKEERRKIAMFCGFLLLTCGIAMQVATQFLPDVSTKEDHAPTNPTKDEFVQDSPLADPETAVWLLQFGQYSSRTNAERGRPNLYPTKSLEMGH